MMTRSLLRTFLVAIIAMAGLSMPAAAQNSDDSRGVHIIEGAPATQGQPSAPLSPQIPSANIPLEPPQVTSAPTASAMTMDPRQVPLKVENSAGVSIEILPRNELNLGDTINFRVTTKKPGYLIIVDIDASGKLTQLFPNTRSLLTASGGQESANLIKAARPIVLPEIGNPYAGFEFVAAPPTGMAMVVAILSDRPVQMLDLPDVPPQLVGQAAAVEYLSDWTRSLRIAGSVAAGALEEAKWSIDAKFYVIR